MNGLFFLCLLEIIRSSDNQVEKVFSLYAFYYFVTFHGLFKVFHAFPLPIFLTKPNYSEIVVHHFSSWTFKEITSSSFVSSESTAKNKINKATTHSLTQTFPLHLSFPQHSLKHCGHNTQPFNNNRLRDITTAMTIL